MNELIKQFLHIELPNEEESDSIVSSKICNTFASLTIEPVVVQTPEGELVVKYPAKIDLQFDNVKVTNENIN